MKKTIIVMVLLVLLISGCSNKTEIENNPNGEDINVSLVPSQFKSEEELIKTIKAFKQNSKQLVENEYNGEMGNKDELDKIDYYYMPVTVPEDYELYQISISSDNFRSIYVKKGEDFEDPYDTYTFGYWNTSSEWTMENTIKGSKLVQSKYSNYLYFEYRDTIKRYLRAYFEVDNLVCYVLFPYDIDIEDEEQVKVIEGLCQFKKKGIDE